VSSKTTLSIINAGIELRTHTTCLKKATNTGVIQLQALKLFYIKKNIISLQLIGLKLEA